MCLVFKFNDTYVILCWSNLLAVDLIYVKFGEEE
uniref:Uncharacterized protein n=1 Tax=Zea mays TaxID=4577 RepID=B4FDY4_MAIZE|nr:unknown [Zea mays]ACF86276.1 unknown [Zea mays]